MTWHIIRYLPELHHHNDIYERGRVYYDKNLQSYINDDANKAKASRKFLKSSVVLTQTKAAFVPVQFESEHKWFG